MTEDSFLQMERRLDSLKREHRKIDTEIENLSSYQEFIRHSLKRKKLVLRDEIIRIESMIYPDIPA